MQRSYRSPLVVSQLETMTEINTLQKKSASNQTAFTRWHSPPANPFPTHKLFSFRQTFKQTEYDHRQLSQVNWKHLLG